MEERPIRKMHKLMWNNRTDGVITGVVEVISFDPSEIVLDTEQGILVIKGCELRVLRLAVEKGEVEISGRVDGMLYTENSGRKEKKQSMLFRLFQ